VGKEGVPNMKPGFLCFQCNLLMVEADVRDDLDSLERMVTHPLLTLVGGRCKMLNELMLSQFLPLIRVRDTAMGKVSIAGIATSTDVNPIQMVSSMSRQVSTREFPGRLGPSRTSSPPYS